MRPLPPEPLTPTHPARERRCRTGRVFAGRAAPRRAALPPDKCDSLQGIAQLVKKGFDKLVDGEASSPARCRASNLRFEPSAVSPKAKPENPKGFQPPCHPHQFLLKSKRFPGAKTAGKRFLLWKMGFSGAKIVPRPPYTPLGAIGSSRGLRPSRALRGFFDSLCDSLQGIASLRPRRGRGWGPGRRAPFRPPSPARPRREAARAPGGRGRIAPPSPEAPYPHAPPPGSDAVAPGDFTFNRSAGMRRAYNYMLFAQISHCVLACILKTFESSLTDVVDLVIMWLPGYEMSFPIPF